MKPTPRRAAAWNAPGMDRLGFYAFLALALHGLILLGIGFQLPTRTPPQHTLDITLAQEIYEKPPEQVDFLAQAHQQGSGESEEAFIPSTPEEAPVAAETPSQPAAEPQVQPVAEAEVIPPAPSPEVAAEPEPAPAVQTGAQAQVTTQAPQPRQAPKQTQQKPSSPPPPATTGSASSLFARSMEMASLQAQLEMEQQALARKPRVRRLTSSPSTMAQDDAIYLDNWRRHIEAVGNLNYPAEARQQNINGSLRLLVAIRPDGSVENIEILQSSGHAVLDNAAIRIVQLAAPFQPFTNEMRRTTDVLEIIRTWKFEKRAQVY